MGLSGAEPSPSFIVAATGFSPISSASGIAVLIADASYRAFRRDALPAAATPRSRARRRAAISGRRMPTLRRRAAALALVGLVLPCARGDAAPPSRQAI